MVATQHQRNRALIQRLEAGAVEPLTDTRNLVNVFLAVVSLLVELANRRLDVATVDDRTAQRRYLIAEPGDPEGRRPHVDAAPSTAKVERDSDDVDWFQLPTPNVYRIPNSQ